MPTVLKHRRKRNLHNRFKSFNFLNVTTLFGELWSKHCAKYFIASVIFQIPLWSEHYWPHFIDVKDKILSHSYECSFNSGMTEWNLSLHFITAMSQYKENLSYIQT